MNYCYAVFENDFNFKNFIGLVLAKINDDVIAIAKEKFPDAENVKAFIVQSHKNRNIVDMAWFFKIIDSISNQLEELNNCLDLESWEAEKIKNNKNYKIAYEVKISDCVIGFVNAKHENEAKRKLQKRVDKSVREKMVVISYNSEEANNRKKELEEEIAKYNNKCIELMKKIKAE